MLGGTEAPGVSARGARPAPWSKEALAATACAHATVLTIAALTGLFAASVVLRTVIGSHVHGPFVFLDELGYEQMARSFAHTGHFALFGKGGLAYSPLYPVILSPIYALTSSMTAAYEWAKVENAVLISLSVFPVYGIARFVLPRRRSLAVAALSLIAPLMLYSGFEMSESLAYPLCLFAFWTMLRAVRRPSLANDALLLGAILVATAARLQLVVLVPAALTAILVVAVARPEPGVGRLRAAWDAISEHRFLFGVCGVALVAGLARTVTNGGNLPLAGRYSNVGTSHASFWRVLEIAVHHVAELDWAVGVIPFVAALLAGLALVRFGFPRQALVFASVAVASTFWIVLEVAYDAAAFDAPKKLRHARAGFVDLPRIHERYLIYLLPFFLVALFVALGLRNSRFPALRHVVGCAVVAALLPALIPFGTVINGTSTVETFSLLAFGRTVSGRAVPITHATTSIVVLSAVLALIYVLVAARRLPPPAAILVTALAFICLSAVELGRQVTPIPRSTTGLPAHADWVDRVAENGTVSIVSGPNQALDPVRESAFWNASIARVYYTCRMEFGSAWNEQRLAQSSTIRTRYALVPPAFARAGRVLSRDPNGKLVVVAPPGGILRIPADLRCGS